MSENASKADPDSEILYLKVHEFQNTTDAYIAPLDYPVFAKYLTLLFEDIPEAQFDINNDVFLTSEADLLYLKMLMKLIADTPPMHLEMFLWFSVVEDLILYTTTAMRELYYQYLKMITTLEGSSTRSAYCTRSVNKMMGMAVSYLIIEEEFPINTKPKVETMLINIKRAFNNLVRQTEWLDIYKINFKFKWHI